jgi:nucleoid-associated protein YgaU
MCGKFKMKPDIAGILVLSLMVMMLVLPGCAGVEDHWVVPEDPPPPQPAAVFVEEDSSSGAVDEDLAWETRRREEMERKEAEARENAQKQEEEKARLQREAAAQEAEARENIRRQEEEVRLQREAAAQEAEARENIRRQEEINQFLEALKETRRQAEAENQQPLSGEQAGPEDFKPRYYVVQPGDTFNSIAADPRIYNNRSEWFVLYQANKNKLTNSDNPHLLAPGTVIEIPSIAGEVREGIY